MSRTSSGSCASIADRFDTDAAREMPVYGSSFDKSDGQVSWVAKERTADFVPKQRYSQWDQAVHRRFDRVGGACNAAFGYERSPGVEAAPVLDGILDAAWPVRQRFIRAQGFVERRLGR